jgi:uncharacterized membrane protein YdbT with pleckstrin-like domain
MIALNQELHLGRKAYLLMASRKMTAGIVILLIAVIILLASHLIIGWVGKGIAASGTTAIHASTASISGIVNGATIGLFVLGLLVMLAGLITARMEYDNCTFTFEEFDLKLKRGVLGVKEVSIPYRQIQDVDVERDLSHRMTGTARLIIDSAGHEEADEKNETNIILDPIEEGMAEDIRTMMQRKIGVQVVVGEDQADKEAAAQTSQASL